MKKATSVLLALVLCLQVFIGFAASEDGVKAAAPENPAAGAHSAEMSPAEVFDACIASTVHIETSSGGGTGFFVAGNIVATNNHVIAGANWLTVRTYDGQVFNVTAVLACSESPDLALLQVDGTGQPVRINALPLRSGEPLYCIGAPMGIYPCISDGIVMKPSHVDMDVDYILSNFHAIGGNSGGPVFNARGEVVGIVVGGMSDGPNSIDMVINAKYLDTLDTSAPMPISTREEWLAEFNKPDEERYEQAAIADAQVGQLVSFGRYEQDGNTENGPEDILWLVTERKDDRLTLMSLYCLDVVPYSLEPGEVTWETSHVRRFLNEEFFMNAFDADEQAQVAESLVVNNNNPIHGTPGGNDTVDKVYLPSLEEAMAFYGVDVPEETFYDHIYAQATPYSTQKGVWLEIPDSNRCWWWLRSPGGNPENAAEIGSAGYLSFNGSLVVETARAVRPVIQVNIG